MEIMAKRMRWSTPWVSAAYDELGAHAPDLAPALAVDEEGLSGDEELRVVFEQHAGFDDLQRQLSDALEEAVSSSALRLGQDGPEDAEQVVHGVQSPEVVGEVAHVFVGVELADQSPVVRREVDLEEPEPPFLPVPDAVVVDHLLLEVDDVLVAAL